jgi:WD40 repeat protein
VNGTIEPARYVDLGIDTAFPWAVALAPDRKSAAVGTAQGIIHIVDLATREHKVLKIPAEKNPGVITSVEFGERSDSLLVTAQNDEAWLFNTSTGPPVQVFGQHGQPFQASFAVDGRRFATASSDGAVRLWEAGRVTAPPFVLRGHDGPVYSVQFTPDGESLMSAASDGTVKIWSVESALHPTIDRINTRPTAVNSVDDKNQEIRVTSAEGFTVVVHNGARSHLALFGPINHKVPISEWGEKISNWQSASFNERLEAGKAIKSIVAVSATGETYSWPHFKDLSTLTKYAKEQIPYSGQERLKLSERELCKLDLLKDKEKCSSSDRN